MIETLCTERLQHLSGDDSAIFKTFGARVQADYARADRSDAARMLACVDARNEREIPADACRRGVAVAVDLSRLERHGAALPVS